MCVGNDLFVPGAVKTIDRVDISSIQDASLPDDMFAIDIDVSFKTPENGISTWQTALIAAC